MAAGRRGRRGTVLGAEPTALRGGGIDIEVGSEQITGGPDQLGRFTDLGGGGRDGIGEGVVGGGDRVLMSLDQVGGRPLDGPVVMDDQPGFGGFVDPAQKDGAVSLVMVLADAVVGRVVGGARPGGVIGEELLRAVDLGTEGFVVAAAEGLGHVGERRYPPGPHLGQRWHHRPPISNVRITSAKS